jgi:hypothetical protein
MLFYVVDWLPPDFGAVGQYGLIFATEIAREGRDVCLLGLTSAAVANTWERIGDGGSLEIRRLPAKRYNKSGFVSRATWSVRTNLRLLWTVLKDARSRNAEVLFTGAPPFMLYFAVFAKWLRGCRLIYRITDFYPEVLIAAAGKRSPLLALSERVTWALRKQVDVIQALGEDQRRLLIAGGILPERITIKRDTSPITIRANQKAGPRPPELEGRKLLLYSGNLGVPHEINTIVEALIRHERYGGRQFGLWLNASGSSVGTVVARLETEKIPFVRTEPVPLERFPELLVAADVHLITLRQGFAGVVLPSKLYACLDSARPILFIGPKGSDVHLLCARASNTIYEHVEPGDVDACVQALDRLAIIENTWIRGDQLT